MATKKGSKATEAARKDKSAQRARREGDRDVGHALRTIYQKTVDESVPKEMLDLLGKLD